MFRKLIYLVCFVSLLGISITNGADTDDSNLVGWWKFDEGSGDIATDSSGNGFDIPLVDNLWGNGVFGGAVVFPGQGQGQKGGFVYNDNAITVCAWVQHEEFIVGQVERYVTVEPEIAVIRKETDGRLHFYINTGGTLRHLWVSDVLTEGEWHHVAGTWDGITQRLYLDGAEIASQTPGGSLGTSSGVRLSNTPEPFNGMLDDARIYNRALTREEINIVMVGPEYPYASNPSPANGAINPQIWASISWSPGDFAVSHDVYFGDNFDDVNNAARDSEVFRVNLDLDTTYYFAGFAGGAYPDGLVTGTTYYWRIDEINDADPNSPWKGKVWSFLIPPKKAYGPVPSDGSRFIDSANLVLRWTAGYGAKLHYVYFGDDYDTVANATGGTSQGTESFNPGILEPDKTYYWRIDEDDITATHTGDVWSFKTAKIGGGLRAEYYHYSGAYPPSDPFQVLVATEIVPEINWNWGDGSPNDLVNVDDFACKFTGEIEVAFTETYTFCLTTDDGQRLWVDGQPIIDMWVQQGMVEHRGTIDLIAGRRYSIELWMYEHDGGAGCELRWLSPSTPKQIIPQAALSPPVRAMSPSPPNGATGTKMTPILKWGAGVSAASHEVYFGTDAGAVANADKSSPEYKGTKALGDESYDPGKLAWFTTYYWRVDEVNAVNPDSPWTGNLWSFTTGDFIVIDNFEDYNSGENQIWYAWKDGLGYGTPGTADYYAGNGTGAAVGDETTSSYTEETIVHGGSQSMPLSFDNNKTGYSMYSETELTLTDTRDWTDENVAELSIWFRGYPASVGSFVESPAGTFTMTASGADIWDLTGLGQGYHDEFHFAYKILNGAGSITAKVISIDNTNDWAKAGVMIRESLDPDSAHAMVIVTPTQGVSFQRRLSTAAASAGDTVTGIAAPYWVKIDRTIAGLFTASHSADGTTWQTIGAPQTIPMGANIYIGLAVTAHDAALTCQAVFSNITFTGNVTGQWADLDIGIPSNDPEPLYVAVSNSNGTSAIVVHDDPAAAQISTWTEWVIPLSDFADQGINLTDVDTIALGLGTRGNTTAAGGSGKMFFDDIRLCRNNEADSE